MSEADATSSPIKNDNGSKEGTEEIETAKSPAKVDDSEPDDSTKNESHNSQSIEEPTSPLNAASSVLDVENADVVDARCELEEPMEVEIEREAVETSKSLEDVSSDQKHSSNEPEPEPMEVEENATEEDSNKRETHESNDSTKTSINESVMEHDVEQSNCSELSNTSIKDKSASQDPFDALLQKTNDDSDEIGRDIVDAESSANNNGSERAEESKNNSEENVDQHDEDEHANVVVNSMDQVDESTSNREISDQQQDSQIEGIITNA